MLMTSVLLLAAAALIVPPLASRFGRNAGYLTAAAFVASFITLLPAAGEVLGGGTVTQSWRWAPTFDVTFTLRLNGLSLLFAALILGVGALIMSYAPRYVDEHYQHGRLYGILAGFGGSMLALVMSADLIQLLVFWELTTLASFLLVGGRGTAGARPALRALVVTASGGLALLAATVILVVRLGTSDLGRIIARAPGELSSTELAAVGALIVIAAFTKSAQLPFHFWLPGAMVAITPVSAYLHAATLVKAGIYLLLLFSPVFSDDQAWHLTLMSFGIATTLFGAFTALRQHDLKALLAYSTVSQLGLMVALIGVGTSTALAAAVLLVAAHALFKATLFMLVGIIDREAGSRDIRELSGLRHVMPITAALTLLAAGSMAGIPPLVGFVSKEEAFYAFIGTSTAPWTGSVEWAGFLAGGLAVLGASLTFAYSARILGGAFAGKVSQPGLYDPSPAFWGPAAVSAVAGLGLGVAPFVLNGFVNRAVVDTGFPDTPADLALWHGFGTALVMSATAISLGVLLHWRQADVQRVLGGEPPPPRIEPLFDRGWNAALAFGAWVGRGAHATAAGRHLAGVLPLVLLLATASVASGLPLPERIPGTERAGDWVLLALLVGAALALLSLRSTVGLLALAGLVGLVVSVWLLLLGAPDVALTLLLVEILTVVVAAPLLARLPGPPPEPEGKRRRAGAAMASGVLAGAAVWAFTGRRNETELADYFLVNALPETGGANVVNTILVDFRGLDTLGEVLVLAAAALALFGALASMPGPEVGGPRLGGPVTDVLRVGSHVVIPLLALGAAVLFWRGHDEPGGGFIAGLVAGSAVAVARVSGRRVRLPGATVLVGTGIAAAIGAGLFGLVVKGAFLAPVKGQLAGVDLTSSLVFDLGVFLVVLALVQVALARTDPKPAEVPA